jgi:transmembrane sensor
MADGYNYLKINKKINECYLNFQKSKMKCNLTNGNSRDGAFKNQQNSDFKNSLGGTEPMEDKLFEEWKGFTPEKEISDEESDQIYNAVMKEIGGPDSSPASVFSRRKKYARISAIAALLLILVSLTSYYFLDHVNRPRQTDKVIAVHVAPGEMRKIILPDGSVALLNSQSTIRYKESFDRTNRELELQGEAFFTVTKDSIHAFVVKTGNVSTKVHGTRFNVSAYDEENNIVVAVEEGKVEVFNTIGSGSPVFLTRQQKAVCSNQSRDIQKILMNGKDDDFAWLKGGVVFDDLPLNDALRRLQREYNVNFILEDPALGNCTINGSFYNEDIYSILEMMGMSMDFEFDMDSNLRLITIRGNGYNAQY